MGSHCQDLFEAVAVRMWEYHGTLERTTFRDSRHIKVSDDMEVAAARRSELLSDHSKGKLREKNRPWITVRKIQNMKVYRIHINNILYPDNTVIYMDSASDNQTVLDKVNADQRLGLKLTPVHEKPKMGPQIRK